MAPIVGHWNIDGNMIVDTKGMAATIKATQGCEWYLGGYAVVCRTSGTIGGAANESASLMYYDTFRNGYVTTAVGSLKDATGSGAFDIKPGSFVFTSEFLLGGKPARDRMTLSNMTPDGGTWKYELSVAGGPLKPAGEGTYRKVGLP